MSISHLSSEQLTQLIRLVKEKEVLQAKLDQVVQSISSLESGKGSGKKAGRPAKAGASTGKRGKGGRMKEEIMAALKAAGAEGLTVGDLSSKLNVDKRNIFSWFYTTGKKIQEIKQVGVAKYALVA